MATGYPEYNLGNWASELSIDGVPDVQFDFQDAVEQWSQDLNLDRELEQWVEKMLKDFGSM